jgi:hypothetical protein
MGRPTVYNEDIATEICRRVSNGETLSEVCRDDHMPPRQTVVQWDTDNRNGFASRYARAKERQIEYWADELLSISDDGRNDWVERTDPKNPGWQFNGEHVQRSRLRSDNRKWLLAKLQPHKYGDKVENKTTISVDDPISDLLGKIATQGDKIFDRKR